jgi:hypothetical protein
LWRCFFELPDGESETDAEACLPELADLPLEEAVECDFPVPVEVLEEVFHPEPPLDMPWAIQS